MYAIRSYYVPAAQQPEDVAAMEDVAAAGGIDRRNGKGGLVERCRTGELAPAPPLAQGHRRRLGAVREQPRGNVARLQAADQLPGELLAHDQVIDQR